MMRALALEYFGWELATEGDAFLLAFHDPFDAVSFALTFQDALMDEVGQLNPLLGFYTPNLSQLGRVRGRGAGADKS
jgi:class 3 adenylate cyclase